MLYAHLFWPVFVTVDNMTFLPFVVEDDDDRKRIKARYAAISDARRVEEEFNSTEVAELFGRRRSETTAQEDSMLAEYLAELWATKLRLDFPQKTFCVRVVDPSNDFEVGVTLYEQR